MRGLFRLLWMALVLLVVALLSALTTMRFAIHGREVAVPDLRGRTPIEARRIADDAGLAVAVERNYYSPTVPEGRVLSQMPTPGTTVRPGWEVRLALSLGPQRVAIPQVVGDSERAAAINIAQRRLELGSTASVQIPGTDPGQVIAQNPPANATDVSAPKISLLVSQETQPQAFVMPTFVGQPLGSVTATLKSSGFVVGKVTVGAPAPTAAPDIPPPGTEAIAPVASPSPASIIVSQDPAPGSKVLAGSAINFVIK